MSSGREGKKQTTETTQQEGEDLILRRRTNTHPYTLHSSSLLSSSLVLSLCRQKKLDSIQLTHIHSHILTPKGSCVKRLVTNESNGGRKSNVLTTEGTQEEEEVDDKNEREEGAQKEKQTMQQNIREKREETDKESEEIVGEEEKKEEGRRREKKEKETEHEVKMQESKECICASHGLFSLFSSQDIRGRKEKEKMMKKRK